MSRVRQTLVSSGLALALLSGCGTSAKTDLGVKVADQVSFRFIDARSEDDKASATQASSEGLLRTFGDDAIRPVPADLVKTWLDTEDRAKLAGKEVRLLKFEVTVLDPGGKVNDTLLATTSSSSGAGLLGGLLARPFIGAIEDARAAKKVRFYVRVAVDGVEFLGMHNATYQGRVSQDNINETIRTGLRSLAANIAIND